jgi:plasmid maintenance system antidote protein VapI
MRLGKLLKIYYDMYDIGLREVAKEVGVSHSTINRIINGQTTDIQTAIKLLVWLFLPEPDPQNASKS